VDRQYSTIQGRLSLAQIRRNQKGRFISIMSHPMIEEKDQKSHKKQSSGKTIGTTRKEANKC
jgi:hypothetical protein